VWLLTFLLEVHQCEMTGVVAAGSASLTLVGTDQSIYDNCKKNFSHDLGW